MEDRRLKFKKTFEKQTISIQAIGKQRFWLGLTIGIICSIVLALSFSYTRESFRLFSVFSGDLLILENREIVLLNFFFAVLSSVLGFSISLWFWAGNKKYKRKKRTPIPKHSTNTNSFYFLVNLNGYCSLRHYHSYLNSYKKSL